MRTYKILATFALLLVVLLLPACDKTESEQAAPPPPAPISIEPDESMGGTDSDWKSGNDKLDKVPLATGKLNKQWVGKKFKAFQACKDGPCDQDGHFKDITYARVVLKAGTLEFQTGPCNPGSAPKVCIEWIFEGQKLGKKDRGPKQLREDFFVGTDQSLDLTATWSPSGPTEPVKKLRIQWKRRHND